MAASETTAQRYFCLMRESQQQGSLADKWLNLVRMATDAAQDRDYDTVLTILAGLKETLELSRSLLDNSTRQDRALTEIMTLRKENLELAQLLALARGDEEAAAEIGQAINKMDEFFTAAIADLDPEL